MKIKSQVFQKCKGNKKKNEWQKKAFRAEKNNSELKEKGHEPSRVELKISQLELWLEPARFGLITNKYVSLELIIEVSGKINLMHDIWQENDWKLKWTKNWRTDSLYFNFSKRTGTSTRRPRSSGNCSEAVGTAAETGQLISECLFDALNFPKN